MTFRRLLLVVLLIALIQQMPEIIWFTTGDKSWLEKKEKYLSFSNLSSPAPVLNHSSALNRCLDWKFSPEARIEACTYLIEKEKADGAATPTPYSGRGNAYSLMGQYENALNDYDEAVRLNVGNVDYLLHRGIIHKLNRDWDKALVDLDVVVGSRPDWSEAYYRRATIYADKGEIDRAILDTNRAIKITKNHPQALTLRGEMFARKDDAASAMADFNRVIALSKLSFPDAYIGRAELFMRAGNPDQALSDLDDALEGVKVLKGGDKIAGTVHAKKGKVFEELRRKPDAIKSYRQAYELGYRPTWLVDWLTTEGALP